MLESFGRSRLWVSGLEGETDCIEGPATNFSTWIHGPRHMRTSIQISLQVVCTYILF